MTDTNREQMYRDTAASIPLGRVGEVEDVAQAYLFYLTQPYPTGSILTLDGGTVLARSSTFGCPTAPSPARCRFDRTLATSTTGERR
jgi:hypothetical protein